MLVMTLIAVAAAVAAWLRPPPEAKTASPPAPTFTDQQIAGAKANVCDAYRIADKAVVINTHRTNPEPGNGIGELATGIYGDFASDASGDYLLDRLAAEPATPPKLANSIKSLANKMKKIAMIDLAGEPKSVRDPLTHAVDADVATID